jgi:hypothetical protein
MSGRVRVLSVLVIMMMSLLAAGPAAAGGPTSVLLSDPENGRVAALHASGPDYGALASYVSAFSASGQAAPADAPDGSSGTVRLTWLIHDVQVWRTDVVYLDAKGGPWIETRSTMDESADLWNATAVWHEVTDPPRLTALLTKLNVNPLVPPAGSPAAPAAEPAAVAPAPAAATAPPAPATVTPKAAAATQGWTWGLIGLAAGAVLTATGGLLWSRRRPAETSDTSDTSETSLDVEPAPETEPSPAGKPAPAETITV